MLEFGYDKAARGALERARILSTTSVRYIGLYHALVLSINRVRPASLTSMWLNDEGMLTPREKQHVSPSSQSLVVSHWENAAARDAYASSRGTASRRGCIGFVGRG